MQNLEFETDTSIKPLSVLVVDDSRLQRKLVSVHLKKWGFKISEAASGQEAIAICETKEIDMILSDWVMPGMSGLEFCEAFRALPRDRYGYFILLTSKSDKEDIANGLDKGADDFLSKPVNATELRARINAGQRVLDMEVKLQIEHARTNAALADLPPISAEINKDFAQPEQLHNSTPPPVH